MKYAQLVSGLFILSCQLIAVRRAESISVGASPSADAVVAVDGNGTHTTVQQAINAAPAKGNRRFYIQIKPGVYREKIVISKDKAPITLYGDDARTTILTYDDYAGKLGADGKPLRTRGSYSVKLTANDFTAANVTFQNTHAVMSGENDQAIAVAVIGDRVVFRKCRFIGWQDTVYADGGRLYFEDCYIAGQVDYIFGSATVFFHRCELHCVAQGVSITAASTTRDRQFGYVFSHCKITAESPANWKTYLGRPWRPYAAVTFLNTEMADVIASEGWHNWDNPQNEKTARFAEYRSTGTGASLEKRVRWSKQLTDAEAKNYTVENVLRGSDGWDPTATR
jgi:pectinesterase